MGNVTQHQLALFDFEERSPWLVVSLKPRWHEQFSIGVKHFEYRRRFVNGPFNAIIYVSGETKSFAAIAKFAQPIVDSPERISDVAAQRDGIPPGALLPYFHDLTKAFALPLERYTRLPLIPLSEVRATVPNFQPPQQYTFLERNLDLLQKLRANKTWRENIDAWMDQSPS